MFFPEPCTPGPPTPPTSYFPRCPPLATPFRTSTNALPLPPTSSLYFHFLLFFPAFLPPSFLTHFTRPSLFPFPFLVPPHPSSSVFPVTPISHPPSFPSTRFSYPLHQPFLSPLSHPASLSLFLYPVLTRAPHPVLPSYSLSPPSPRTPCLLSSFLPLTSS